jgi:hypothetical protein
VVPCGAGNGLTDALARRCGIGHAFFDHNVRVPSGFWLR